jgi:hypothetical protein
MLGVVAICPVAAATKDLKKISKVSKSLAVNTH